MTETLEVICACFNYFLANESSDMSCNVTKDIITNNMIASCSLCLNYVKNDAMNRHTEIEVCANIIQNFLFPYLNHVYFSIKGAFFKTKTVPNKNLKENGKRVALKIAITLYDGSSG